MIRLVEFYLQKLKTLDLTIQLTSPFVLQPIYQRFLLDSLTSFEEIGISSAGRNYNTAPNLVVLDGLTGKQVKDVDIFYSLGDTKVTIRKNTSGLTNVTQVLFLSATQMELQLMT